MRKVAILIVFEESDDELYGQSSPYESWQLLCRHYSFRELTIPADKLPAISGLARRFAQRETSDAKYLAGLWEDDILNSLFWYPATRGMRPIDYRAPSWSWASLDGVISWLDCRSHFQGHKSYCKIIHAQTTPLGLDPLGAVKDGYLMVVGPMLKVDLSWNASVDYKWSSEYKWCLTDQGMQVAKGIPDTFDEAGTLSMDKSNIWALLFDTYENGDEKAPDEDGGELVSRGLLLRNIGQERDNAEVFQRVGIFQGFDEASMNNPRETCWKYTEQRTVVIV